MNVSTWNEKQFGEGAQKSMVFFSFFRRFSTHYHDFGFRWNAKTEWRNIDWLGYYEQLKLSMEVDPVHGTKIRPVFH